MASWRLGAMLFTLFGAIALIIAAGGLFGAMQYAVTERMHEMGIRMALGAQRRQVLLLIIGRAVRIAVGGILAGTVLALGAATFVAPLLYQTSPREPAVFALVAAVLLAVAVVASIGPARAATGADPADALRAD
jgi:putative ABC transport system permease protein